MKNKLHKNVTSLTLGFGLGAALVLGSLPLLSGCSAPRTAVKTDDQAGTLVFKVVPGFAEVYVDGEKQGKAREYNGESAVLKVSPGTRTVTLKAEGYEDFEKKVYLSDTQEIIEAELRKAH